MNPEQKKKLESISLLMIALASMLVAAFSVMQYTALVKYINHIETAAEKIQDSDGGKTCFYRINLDLGYYHVMCLNEKNELSIETVVGD